jgi:hypothetical protein
MVIHIDPSGRFGKKHHILTYQYGMVHEEQQCVDMLLAGDDASSVFWYEYDQHKHL